MWWYGTREEDRPACAHARRTGEVGGWLCVKRQHRAGALQARLSATPDAQLEQGKEIAANKASDEAVKAARAIARAQKRAKKAEEESVVATARVANLCRVCVTRAYRGGRERSGCGCGRFRVCPGCTNSMAAAEVLAGHLDEYPGGVLDGSGSGGDEESEEYVVAAGALQSGSGMRFSVQNWNF